MSKPPYLDLADLLESWCLSLRAERKSAQTLKSYRAGVEQYLTWCADHELPAVLNRRQVQAWCASLAEAGREASTVASRQLAVRRFSAWLTAEGEIDADPLLGLKPPKLDKRVIEPLTEDELRALLATCKGRDFLDRRDNALLRFMLETGVRAGECAALKVSDVDLIRGIAVVRRGKGGKGRIVPIGAQAAQAMDRYRRARAQHRLAASDDWWLGDRGKAFTYDGLHKALAQRAASAGIDRFHPHLLRHTAAHRWLAAGGSEAGLMAVAGWERPEMLHRYTRARATDRAIAEAQHLNLGEL